MPYALKNTPGKFQRAMNVLLTTVEWQFVLVNLDSIVIFSRTPDEHIDNVRQVLTVLYDADVILNLEEMRISTYRIDYLGHVNRPQHLTASTRMIDLISILDHRTRVTELRSFLGLYNVFRCFVANFTSVATPAELKVREGQL